MHPYTWSSGHPHRKVESLCNAIFGSMKLHSINNETNGWMFELFIDAQPQ